jgi:hypothetical protein
LFQLDGDLLGRFKGLGDFQIQLGFDFLQFGKSGHGGVASKKS